MVDRQPVEHRLRHGGVDRVAGNRGDLAVKSHVAGEEAGQIVQTVAMLLKPPLQPRDIVVTRPLGGKADHADLEEDAGLLQVLKVLRGGGEEVLGASPT